jgi:Fic family protein
MKPDSNAGSENARLLAAAARVAEKKSRLDGMRPLPAGAARAIERAYDVELTFTSNAIEGNTLTLRETAELIEHGITVGGKPLRDHLEAVDHYEAVRWVRELAGSVPLGEAVVRELHRRIVLRSQPEIAGFYSSHIRRIAGSPVVFPNPMKIPELMRDFGIWLSNLETPDPLASFDAHFRLSAIHPFSDGNGRTCRLLMNLMLIRAGYPPVAVRPVDRNVYLDALETASLTGDLEPFRIFLYARLDATIQAYIEAD